MIGLIKKLLVRLLSCIVSASNYTKCVLLSLQQCTTHPTFLNLHPKEYT